MALSSQTARLLRTLADAVGSVSVVNAAECCGTWPTSRRAAGTGLDPEPMISGAERFVGIEAVSVD